MSDWYMTMDDSFWLNPDEGGDQEANFVGQALKLRKGDIILDAPCGTGRILYHLVKSGYAVTGLDLRSNFIDRAKSRLEQEGLAATFHVMDLREMNFRDQYHGVFNWGGSFGYYSEEENIMLLEKYVQALRHKGRLLVAQRNREYVLRHFEPERTLETYTIYRKWDKNTQRLNAERRINGKVDRKNDSSMRYYTPKQMQTLFEKVGLTVEEIYGNFSGDKYERTSERMITVGRKY